MYEIAPEDPLAIVYEGAPDVFGPVEKTIAMRAGMRWPFPARSVSAVELELTT